MPIHTKADLSPSASQIFVGLMSGTSLDAIDAVMVDFGNPKQPKLLAASATEFPGALREELLALTQPGSNEIERMGRADRLLAKILAEAVKGLLKETGISASTIAAIGSHGQTIRHRPTGEKQKADPAFSLQIGDPNSLAFETGITTVADFRRKDIAAGGQGAPLAPALHAEFFGDDEENRAVINIGGMSNVTFIPSIGDVLGFDTGPGNVLMDAWIKLHQNKEYDSNGEWASNGKVNPELLNALMGLPFFKQLGSVSTGREDFCLEMLHAKLASAPAFTNESPVNVQATLLEYTARTIANGLQFAAQNSTVNHVYICGGGAFNGALMQRLSELLAPAKVDTTQVLGIPPEWVEGVAFAWLAQQTLCHWTGNLASVTGAKRNLILGGIYSAN